MEFLNKLRGVLDCRGRLPGSISGRIAKPMDIVLELIILQARAEDFFDFILRVTLDHNRWWLLGLAARDGVRTPRFEEADMENRMDPHGLGEIQLEGARPYLGNDGERAQLLVIKLLGWAIGLDILGVQPDLVSNLEIRLRHDLVVKVLGMGLEGFGNVELEVGMKFFEFTKVVLGPTIGLG